MSRLSVGILVAALGVTVMTTSGCLLFVAGAGAGVGAVAYYDNELVTSREVTLERAWDAANAVMVEMEYTITPSESQKDATGGIVQGRNASNQIVRIKVTRLTEKTTEIRIRVGAFATTADQRAENLLLEKLCKRF